MDVDLHMSDKDLDAQRWGGIVTLRCGKTFYSLIVGLDKDGQYCVRIENGVYWGYERDGRRLPNLDLKSGLYVRWSTDDEEHPTDVINFQRKSDKEISELCSKLELVLDFFGNRLE